MEQMISPTFESARQQVERVRAAYEKGMLSDPRFRHLVDSCVAMAREECGRIDPEDADRGAYKQATYAAGMLLARVYDQDGELAAMRAERDRFRSLAEDMLMVTPRPMFTSPKP